MSRRCSSAQTPRHNRELYQALRYHMDRDYSPTYFFRISRAEELLKLYREEPDEFKKLYYEYRNQVDPAQRAPHRLSVWLRPEDLTSSNCDDLRREKGKSLVDVFDDPKFFGFTLRRKVRARSARRIPQIRIYTPRRALHRRHHRLYRVRDAQAVRADEAEERELGLRWRSRRWSSRSTTRSVSRAAGWRCKGEMPAHCTGQVFDIALANLPPGQREALDFVLDDLGLERLCRLRARKAAHADVIHVGAAPTARDFFAKIYQDAVNAKGE